MNRKAAWGVLLAAAPLLIGGAACSSSGGCNTRCQAAESANAADNASLSAAVASERSATAGFASWTTPINSTTCDQWMNEMTPDQQQAVSQELIVRLQAYDQSAEFASDFASNITTACGAKGGEGLTLRDIAASIAALDSDDFH